MIVSVTNSAAIHACSTLDANGFRVPARPAFSFGELDVKYTTKRGLIIIGSWWWKERNWRRLEVLAGAYWWDQRACLCQWHERAGSLINYRINT